ncbi:hypothetical protein DV711_04295 [Motiliproteus coralliicola]|uniref:Uncharacterized protein n=1 Tax=Motiliproteus coralliicola TaxID=2283196 RepID=A0A369WTA1_9GAMM|nr:hypothetical protein [Motiliproteus coralliicola]RDE24811.1 hypothetical protein DV711_04295 [Motiliproteus coralliicola]
MLNNRIISDLNAKDTIYKNILYFVLGISFAGAIFFFPEGYHQYAQEDGIIETAGAIFFGLSSLFFFSCIFRIYKSKNSKLLLAISGTLCWAVLAFVCFGEEISWGQRIFNFETPSEIKVTTYHSNEGMLKNMQNETNIHNMGFFYEYIGAWKITMGLLILIGIVYPISAYFSPLSKLYKFFNLPVPPLYLIGLSISGILIQYGLKDIAYFPNDTSETYEMLLGLMFFLFSKHAWSNPQKSYL